MREKNVNRVWEGWENVSKSGGLRKAKRRRNDVLTHHKDIAAKRGAAVTAVLNAGVVYIQLQSALHEHEGLALRFSHFIPLERPLITILCAPQLHQIF
jgi:hypothetical protein